MVECRKFANFFQNKRGPMKDPLQQGAIAKDFVSKSFRPKLDEWKKWEDRINRQLMHLSYGRVDKTEPRDGSANKPIFEALCVVWDEFLQCADPKLKPEFDVRRSQLRAALAVQGV